MGIFTRISSDAFDALQLDAGVLLSSFDPNNPYAVPSDEDIICTTSGGINPTCTPTYSDFGDDVDNVPTNMLEFKHLDGWDCAMAFTSIKFNAAGVKLALGAADTTTLTNGVTKITPRRNVNRADFGDIWWVGDKADGGAAAIRLKNALSTGGFGLQTSKNAKGTISMTITGHVSLYAQNDMPMEFYDIPAEVGTGWPLVQYLTNVTSNKSSTSVDKDSALSITLTAASNYTLTGATISVEMGGVDITAMAYSAGSISIAKVTAPVVVTAIAVASS